MLFDKMGEIVFLHELSILLQHVVGESFEIEQFVYMLVYHFSNCFEADFF